MPLICSFPYFTVFLAMVPAIIMSCIRRDRVCYAISLATAIISTVMSAAFLIWIVRENTSFAFTMGKFPAPFGNEIKAGPLQALFATCFSLVMAMALLGGRKDLFADVRPGKLSLACVMYNMILASLLVLVYTNDIFTAYVFIEISTIAACALVMIRESGETLIATIRYLFMSLLGSGLFLFGVIILYGITGQLLMPQLTQMIQKVMADGTYHVPLFISAAMITAGLGIKSAMYPFHRWLPGAHGSATTTSSAVLSGLVLKGYAVLIITLFVRVFRMSTIRTLGVNYVVFFLGVAGMIIGSIYAIRESHIKRMLAYSSVAQLGYVFMGIGLATPAGIAAACYQILAHAFVKPMLFLSAGRLSGVTGHQKDLRILRGSAWRAPLAGVAFVVGALSMIGIPLLAGFSSKLNFALAEFHTTWETAMILTGLAVSTLLNALYYIPAVIGIWSDNESRNLYQFTPARDFSIAAVILMICVVALGVFFRPVMAVIEAGLALM